MSARETLRAIAERRLSCAEAMEGFLAAARRHAGFNAVVALRPENELMAEARALDAGPPRGPLHGLPFCVKDLAPAAGLQFTQGSPLFADRVSAHDAPFVARIRAAGAVIAGRTNTPEWGLGSQTHNPVHGTTANAYDRRLTSGGSSGGAAVALALRIVDLADGSDHAGSLRNPAGWNGVLGLRPTLGRVPDEAADPFSAGLSTAGPMARNVDDLALLLGVMAGPHPGLPLSLTHDAEEPPRRLRVGWLRDLGGRLATEPGVLEACEDALRALEEAGAVVEPAGLGFPPEQVWDAWVTLRHAAVGGALAGLADDPAGRDRLKPEAIWEVEGFLRLSARALVAAQAVRGEWFRATLALFERFDVLALPTAQVFPFPLDVHWPREVGGRAMDTYHRWMEVAIAPTMAGGPVLAVPVPGDRRMGLQLWGPWRSEARLLSLGRAYEAATGFPERRPPGA